ncbi:protealysin inhibitor emfourin [Subtercola boreus]|uniref:Uncharacterized protein n=1 Tax=Subtercola boreus TaxID=120213 RepID=A0A3E0W975_9MICO|nr:protealysin inhibitor emfourin [Subtercola boreus]RFA19261.1 hypothetical protein B7R24_11410 [Subtercola boreus]RFA19521.1 hypothetical protein B7R23_11390 [Subtercola boreus]RFA25887.1 hypothetical protein B7R25_11510 [Subtercola boreus]
MEQPADAGDQTEHAVAVTVVRSGGFAGLKRTWEATTDDPSAAEGWLGLADALPWGQAPTRDTQSADRFVYRIVIVVRAEIRHEATLPESALTGGWRDLVDRVQKQAASAG